jgi:putative DNA primase/helicase
MPSNEMHQYARLYDNQESSEIRAALDAIPADIAYEDWVRIGMALKAQQGEPGFYLFDEWSAGSEQYKPTEIRQKWRSFRRNGITIKSLFKLARQHGWTKPENFTYTPRPVDKTLVVRERNERRESQVRASEVAQSIWDSALPAISHPYLQAKGSRPHGIHILGNALLIPMRIGQKTWSIQRIYPNGGKYFMRGGRVIGCYHSIGKLTDRLWIAEGFATGASVHEATGDAVAVAFSCGNMAKVARHFRNHPIELLIASDSDQAGQDCAMKAMKAGCASRMVYPDFKPGDPGKDWNDHCQLYGKAKTREELSK